MPVSVVAPVHASHHALCASLCLLLLAMHSGCSDARVRPTFPVAAAQQPVIAEQALLGLSDSGDALAAELLFAEGNAHLSLLVLDAAGGPSRTLSVAPDEIARAVAAQIEAQGSRLAPLLGTLVVSLWPAPVAAARDSYPSLPPNPPASEGLRWTLRGVGALPLNLRLSSTASGPASLLLLLSGSPDGVSDGDEAQLAELPLSGAQVEPQLWMQSGIAWLLAGSVRAGRGPLHRMVGLRRASLTRGEAVLHNQHGLADYGAGELTSAKREFERALEADPRFVDALYNAASVAALESRADDAVALLRRAAEEDRRRVQVLGRNDTDLRGLRQRPDVREILGLARLPPGE